MDYIIELLNCWCETREIDATIHLESDGSGYVSETGKEDSILTFDNIEELEYKLTFY